MVPMNKKISISASRREAVHASSDVSLKSAYMLVQLVTFHSTEVRLLQISTQNDR